LRELVPAFWTCRRESTWFASTSLIGGGRKLKRGQLSVSRGRFLRVHLCRQGSGFFKTDVLTEDGRDQVTGFQMAGEILGMDGISTETSHLQCRGAGRQRSLSDPVYRAGDCFPARFDSLQHHLHKVMSREIVRDHGVMMLLGTMRAEERLAAFLLNLSQRFTARGYSPTEFHLRMTREEIGSYLGLKLETVSRAFSRFQDDGLDLRATKAHPHSSIFPG
jgi:CRP/FNR family transcriptional regulator